MDDAGAAGQHHHHHVGVVFARGQIKAKGQFELEGIHHRVQTGLIHTAGHAAISNRPGTVKDQRTGEFRDAILAGKIHH